MGYICEARREAGVEFWRESVPDAGCVVDGLLVTLGRGDAGTELRSGAMVLKSRSLTACWGAACPLLYPATGKAVGPSEADKSVRVAEKVDCKRCRGGDVVSSTNVDDAEFGTCSTAEGIQAAAATDEGRSGHLIGMLVGACLPSFGRARWSTLVAR
jgi:hypothetical protein